MKKLNFYSITLIIFLSFALFIGGSMYTGYWQTERAATPKIIEAGSFQGQYDPYDIRGSYTIEEILTLYQIPKQDFYTGLELPASLPTSSKLKELESIVNGEEYFEVSDVRDFVAFYLGIIPEIPENSEHETVTIGDLATESTTNAQESNAYTQDSQDNQSGEFGSGLGNPNDPTIDHDNKSTTTPTGGTTMAQVYEWGISREMMEKQFEVNFDHLGISTETTLRNFSDQTGIKMYDIKEFISSKM